MTARQPDLLLLNANTNTAMTGTMLGAARKLHPNCRAATVARGARYISDAATAAVAAEAVVEFADTLDRDDLPDALVLACFGDPGLWQMRDRLPVSVIGMADASCHVACQMGRRFGIVTGGSAWEPMLQRLVNGIGLGGQLSGIHTLDETGDQLSLGATSSFAKVACKIEEAERAGADVVILGGAGLVGYADRLQDDYRIPLLDSLACAVSQAVSLASLRQRTPSA